MPGVTMTESEFVAWCNEDVRAEWVDGEVFIMSPSNVEHDDLQIWLIRLLGEYVESKATRCDQSEYFRPLFAAAPPPRA